MVPKWTGKLDCRDSYSQELCGYICYSKKQILFISVDVQSLKKNPLIMLSPFQITLTCNFIPITFCNSQSHAMPSKVIWLLLPRFCYTPGTVQKCIWGNLHSCFTLRQVLWVVFLMPYSTTNISASKYFIQFHKLSLLENCIFKIPWLMWMIICIQPQIMHNSNE